MPPLPLLLYWARICSGLRQIFTDYFKLIAVVYRSDSVPVISNSRTETLFLFQVNICNVMSSLKSARVYLCSYIYLQVNYFADTTRCGPFVLHI